MGPGARATPVSSPVFGLSGKEVCMGFEDKLRAAVAAEKLVPHIDWPGIRLAWLSAGHRLSAQVECWMTRGKPPAGARVRRASVTLFEYPVGYYECPALELEVKGRLIHFQPVATLVVGAFGRIDV